MLIAERKKEKNIAEYIIYIWQTEDLIRAYEFNFEKIETSIINFLPLNETDKSRTSEWYKSLIEQMQSQGIQEKGHLNSTKEIINDLFKLHTSLLEVIEDANYAELYEKAREKIKLFQSFSQEFFFNEVEICMNSLYGLLLLRLENKPVPPDLLSTIDDFGTLLSYLAFKYNEKQGGHWN